MAIFYIEIMRYLLDDPKQLDLRELAYLAFLALLMGLMSVSCEGLEVTPPTKPPQDSTMVPDLNQGLELYGCYYLSPIEGETEDYKYCIKLLEGDRVIGVKFTTDCNTESFDMHELQFSAKVQFKD